MSTQSTLSRCRAPALTAMATAVLSILPVNPAASATKFWLDGTGWWNVSTHWSPAGQPRTGDIVFLTQSDGVDRTVLYLNTLVPTPVLSSLNIDATGSGSMTLDMTSGTAQTALNAGNQTVGIYGRGSFLQGVGTNTAGSLLSLGYYAGSSGNYLLGGSGILNAAYTTVGEAGAGTFTQSGGTHGVTNSLALGEGGTGQGTYVLSGGSLVTGSTYLAKSGSASFVQAGGSHVTEQLELLASSGRNTSYALSGGDLETQRFLAFGASANGTVTFDQSGGTHSVGSEFRLGERTIIGGLGVDIGGVATYILGGSGHLQTEVAYVGYRGAGSLGIFVQNGGTHTTRQLHVGFLESSVGQYTMNAGLLTVDGDAFIGHEGTGTFVQEGGLHAVGGTLHVGGTSAGVYRLNGGTLDAARIEVGPTGIFEGTGGEVRAAPFVQAGGTVIGVLRNEGTFRYDSGLFNGRLVNRGSIVLNADFTAGNGLENHSALMLPAGRTVRLEGAGLDNRGFVDLQGGTLAGVGPLLNSGLIRGHGTFSSTGTLTNEGTVLLEGSATFTGPVLNRDLIVVVQSDATFSSPVINTGFVKAQNASITFAGGYTESGTWSGDASTVLFGDLTVEATGRMLAGEGVIATIEGDFLNHSLLGTQWNTNQARLAFRGDAEHRVALAGADFGPGFAGYVNNFAWGSLDIGAGAMLELSDGNGTPGGALYVRVVDLGGDLGRIAGVRGNGHNIYYDPVIPENAFLNGQAYALTGGGQLAPVPEPATYAMMFAGLSAVGLLAHRKTAPRGGRHSAARE